MLDDYRKLFKQVADLIPDWKQQSKSSLINNYVENVDKNPQLANSYAAAVITKNWNLVNKYIYMNAASNIDEFTALEWLTEAFLYTVKKKKWKDPNNKLFHDINGPDKVFNRCVIAERKIYYQSANYDKRKANYASTSIETLQEDKKDYILPSQDNLASDYDLNDIYISDMIKRSFDKDNILEAFTLYLTAYGDTFVNKKIDNKSCKLFNMQKLVKALRTLDDNFIDMFANKFNLENAKVKRGVLFCKECSPCQLKKSIDKIFSDMKRRINR